MFNIFVNARTCLYFLLYSEVFCPRCAVKWRFLTSLRAPRVALLWRGRYGFCDARLAVFKIESREIRMDGKPTRCTVDIDNWMSTGLYTLQCLKPNLVLDFRLPLHQTPYILVYFCTLFCDTKTVTNNTLLRHAVRISCFCGQQTVFKTLCSESNLTAWNRTVSKYSSRLGCKLNLKFCTVI
jgi:hypothetical protein